MTTWFTADEHYGHDRILEYCEDTRPFRNTNRMNKAFIHNHNELVQHDDKVFHIGDFAWKGWEHFVSRLNGTHILIFGSHDDAKPFKFINLGFQSAHTSFALTNDMLDADDPTIDHPFYLIHDPATFIAIPKGGFLLHGHIHSLWHHLLPHKKAINVGVDVWNCKPVSMQQILELIENNS
jgi:calcineurin-like phosphoesterase family protein